MDYIVRLMIVFAYLTSIISIPIEPKAIIDVDSDIRIDLFTLKNPSEPQILIINDKNSITASNYNQKIPTRILIHGFGNENPFLNNCIGAYLKESKRKVNLIAINWSKASNTLNYLSARRSVSIVGLHTAKFIDFMVENKLLELSKLIVIGFSLGAHVAGFAGKNIQSGKLPKIIGLDPASILFNVNKPGERLNSTDAIYVETIQTSLVGFKSPIGSVSFYPNGGRSQPNCKWDTSCSHEASYNYFLQTILIDTPFYGDYCDSRDEVKKGECNSTKQAVMGGEPGVKKQYVTFVN